MQNINKYFGMFLVALSLLLRAGFAQANSLTEWCINISSDCQTRIVQSQSSDGVVEVLSALQIHTMYSDIQLVEIAIKNLEYDKQIYIYDHNKTYDFEKSITVRLKEDQFAFRNDYGDGAGLYLGPMEDGRDRFIVWLNRSHRNARQPIDVYVKMGQQQYQTVSVYF